MVKDKIYCDRCRIERPIVVEINAEEDRLDFCVKCRLCGNILIVYEPLKKK